MLKSLLINILRHRSNARGPPLGARDCLSAQGRPYTAAPSPGSYTPEGSEVNGTTGAALAEIYEQL
jgi:hypothetical protein